MRQPSRIWSDYVRKKSILVVVGLAVEEFSVPFGLIQRIDFGQHIVHGPGVEKIVDDDMRKRLVGDVALVFVLAEFG